MPRVSGDELQRDCYYLVTVRSPAQAGFFNACTSLGKCGKGNVGGTFRYRLVFALVVWGVSVFPAAPLVGNPQVTNYLRVSLFPLVVTPAPSVHECAVVFKSVHPEGNDKGT